MDENGQFTEYNFDGQDPYPFAIEVQKGQIMQWQADQQTGIAFYEICYPPFADDTSRGMGSYQSGHIQPKTPRVIIKSK